MDAEKTEDLAERFQRTAPRGHDLGCVAPERIWDAVFGELPFAELRAITDHSVRCGDCSDALRLARELKLASAPQERAPARHSFRSSRWLIGVALAASVAGLVVVGTNQRRNAPEPELERGVAAPQIRSALASARQSRTNLLLRWQAYPGATRYNVTLATADLQVLFQKSGLDATEVPVPAAATAGVAPGTRLVWRVEASLVDGRTVESPAFSVDVD
jgi:hypothetical protein